MQKHKYNDKEFIEMHGLDEYDSQARWFYPAIMRTTTIDPLAEVKPWLSPYMWCSGNPVNRTDPTGMIDDQVLPEVTVTAPKKNKNSNFNYEFQQLLDNANRNKPKIPKITPPIPVFNLQINSNANTFVNLKNIDEKKNSTLDDISLALSAIGIAADQVQIFTENNAGKKIIYVTLKGTTAAANTTKVLSALKGISNATIVVGVVVDAVHVAVDPSYAGKAILNTGVTIVATIIGATISAPAGLVIGGGYLLLDQFGAFDRPTNIPYYNHSVCPQDNTKINIPYK